MCIHLCTSYGTLNVLFVHYSNAKCTHSAHPGIGIQKRNFIGVLQRSLIRPKPSLQQLPQIERLDLRLNGTDMICVIWAEAIEIDGKPHPQLVLLDHGLYYDLCEGDHNVRLNFCKYWKAWMIKNRSEWRNIH